MATSDQTKMQFATTLKDLMHHKPLDRITIAELSAATHVNRNTFYYHFEDIYGLLKWTLEADIGRKVMQNLGAATGRPSINWCSITSLPTKPFA